MAPHRAAEAAVYDYRKPRKLREAIRRGSRVRFNDVILARDLAVEVREGGLRAVVAATP